MAEEETMDRTIRTRDGLELQRRDWPSGDEAGDDEPAEAVAEQHERALRLAANGVEHGREIEQEVVFCRQPAALAGARAVTALVVADDAPAARVQACRDMRIAADVLAEAVDDDNRSPGIAGRPVASHELEAVAGTNRPVHRFLLAS
jgi:hypothetical protein